VYSTDYNVELTEIRRAQARGDTILYEYIGEIHEDLWGKEVPAQLIERHRALVRDASVLCVATARKLFDQVQRVRAVNVVLVSNGVDVEHFARARGTSPPAEINSVVARGRPIVGYHGAFAKWFDYDLVRVLCEARPQYEVVLLGVDIDGSLAASGIAKLKNLTAAGPVPYSELPKYSAWFDVAMVPFKVNAITESTSPIKLFEYMALGKPAVSTDLRECRQYRSVLIAHTSDAFVGQVDRALGLKSDSKHLALLREDARHNTWQSKSRAIAHLLRGQHGLLV
jgi:glycosyltransferase involved in cell wall biosynthesis